MIRSLTVFFLFILGCLSWYTLYSSRSQSLSDLTTSSLPAELRKKDTTLPSKTSRVASKKFDRGYIVNERQQAISLRIIDYKGRILDLYHLFPGESARITRFFDTITTLVVNGTMLKKCIVQGVEKPQAVDKQANDTIVIRDNENFAPYLECIDRTSIE